MLRDLKGWTQEQLAQRSGISATNISLLENEKVDIGKQRRLSSSPRPLMFIPPSSCSPNMKPRDGEGRVRLPITQIPAGAYK